jgi:hypothetical protein
MDDATIYNPKESSVGGTHAFFLVRGDPKTYNLPPNPIVPTTLLKPAWNAVAIASAAMAIGSLLAFALGGRPSSAASRHPLPMGEGQNPEQPRPLSRRERVARRAG